MLGIVGTAAFMMWLRRSPVAGAESLLPATLFGRGGFPAGLLVQALVFAAMNGLFFVLELLLQQGWHLTAWQAGLVLIPCAADGAFVGLALAPLVHRAGLAMIIIGALAQAVGASWLAHVLTGVHSAPNWATAAWPLALVGAGLAAVMAALNDQALRNVHPKKQDQPRPR